jgi:tetratricopeptide (TPR) repeat protein
VEELYDHALAAYWTEQWDEAVELLGQVLDRQPDYADAGQRLELARHQQQLDRHYAQASAAADDGNWGQAVAEYTMIAEADPDYRDTNARLANARRQHQLASLQAEARRLHRAGQWMAVMKVVHATRERRFTSCTAEGRYRLKELFRWRPTLQELVSHSDIVKAQLAFQAAQSPC